MKQENIDKITSDIIEKQIEGLDALIGELDGIYDICVNALESSSDGMFIAERIHMMKHNLEVKLLTLFEKTKESDLRFNIAAIIYEDTVRYDHIKKYLLDYIMTHKWPQINTPFFILRQRKVKEIIPVTIHMLENVDVNDIDHVNFLLDTMRSFQVALPENIRSKFSSAEVPWQVRIK